MQKTTFKKKNIILSFLSILFFLFTGFFGNAQVGIGTTNPLSTFEVNGTFGQKVNTITDTTTLDDTFGSLIICDNGATVITVTLPAVASCTGRVYTIKRNTSTTANVTIAATIDGVTNLVLAKAGEAVTLFSNGTEWKAASNNNLMATSNWNLAGNAGTDPATNFVGTSDAKDLVIKTNSTEQLRVVSGGNIGIGLTAPTAYLHIKAGTAAAETAPLKLTDGPLTATAEPGAIEYKGHTFYASTSLVRRSIMLAQDVVVQSVPVTGTDAETTIYTATLGAGYLTPGKMINIKLFGSYRTASIASSFTIKVRLAGVTVLTVTSRPVTTNAFDRPIDLDISSIIRTIGTAGTIISYGKVQQDDLASNMNMGISTGINTTIANDITVTVKWTVNDTNNRFSLEGGATECVDANY